MALLPILLTEDEEICYGLAQGLFFVHFEKVYHPSPKTEHAPLKLLKTMDTKG